MNLTTGYEKLNNDMISMATGYKTSVDIAVSGSIPMEDYIANLTPHLEKAKLLRAFAQQGVEKTKNSIASVRVLINDNKTPLSSLRVFFVIHKDPDNFDRLKSKEKEKLENQIVSVKKQSSNEIRDVEKGLNK